MAKEATTQTELVASADFRSVRMGDSLFTFSSKQASIVEILWGHLEAGVPEVGESYLLSEIGSGKRLSDLFKRNEAWGRLIIRGERTGNRRLNCPGNNFRKL